MVKIFRLVNVLNSLIFFVLLYHKRVTRFSVFFRLQSKFIIFGGQTQDFRQIIVKNVNGLG